MSRNGLRYYTNTKCEISERSLDLVKPRNIFGRETDNTSAILPSIKPMLNRRLKKGSEMIHSTRSYKDPEIVIANESIT